jgi:hypothetical protein
MERRHRLVRGALALAMFVGAAACGAVSSGTPPGEDSSAGADALASCVGLYGKVPAADGKYDATEFGCWVDKNGKSHSDPGDNCVPTCLPQAQQSVCKGMSGAACERSINWFSADAARFGCMQRIRVTSAANGKSVVLVALDFGPNCSLENKVKKPLLDMSGAATEYLFGGEVGYQDGAHVSVELVDGSTPLGPVVQGSSSSSSSGNASSSSGNASSSSSGGAACAHALCDAGAALEPSCDPCAQSICAGDPYCCASAWDSQCTGEVASVCGQTCGGSSSSSSSSSSSGGGASCSGDGDCNPGNNGSGLICASGQCVPGCHTDAQCPGVTTCVGGMCQ